MLSRLSPTLRLARCSDIPAALRLCRLSGWNQLERDWARLLDHEPEGCFVAELDGNVVGTVTTTCYAAEMAWIGMMLVHPEFRRRGIATQLMQRSVEYLHDRGVGCIKLDATPEGHRVYHQLGFTNEWSLQRWMRPGSKDAETPLRQSPPSKSSTESGDADLLGPYLTLDRAAFGVDRHEWLTRLLPDARLCCRSGAMGMLRPGFLANYLGPLTASSPGAAREIIEALLDGTTEPVFWDIPDPNHKACELARSLKFEPTRQLTRMWLGSRVESDLALLYGLSDPSTG